MRNQVPFPILHQSSPHDTDLTIVGRRSGALFTFHRPGRA